MDTDTLGLKKLRSGNGITRTPATPNSKTQQRKANLANYNMAQRKFGASGKIK